MMSLSYLRPRKSHKFSFLVLVGTLCITVTGVVAPEPMWMPQLRQQHSLENGICKKALAISVCIEGSMARSPVEFSSLTRFISQLIRTFHNVQPGNIMMAINYCSYIKEWTDWTPSTTEFASHVMKMTWPYSYYANPGLGNFGGYEPYGALSVLHPDTGTCLEKARYALSQVPPNFQRFIILFTSGYSSNPLLTVQHAQAAMLEGTEIFGITGKEYGISEELRMSVSGGPYMMAVKSLMSLGKKEIDHIIMTVCRIERSSDHDSSDGDPQDVEIHRDESAPLQVIARATLEAPPADRGLTTRAVNAVTRMAAQDTPTTVTPPSVEQNGEQVTLAGPVPGTTTFIESVTTVSTPAHETAELMVGTTRPSEHETVEATPVPTEASMPPESGYAPSSNTDTAGNSQPSGDTTSSGDSQPGDTQAGGSSQSGASSSSGNSQSGTSSSSSNSNPSQQGQSSSGQDVDCVDVSGITNPVVRKFKLRGGKKACSVDESITSAPTTHLTTLSRTRRSAATTFGSNAGSTASEKCVDLSGVPEFLMPLAKSLVAQIPVCGENGGISTTPSTVSAEPNCIDLSQVPEFLKPLVLSANGGKPACPDTTPITTAQLTIAPITTTPATTSVHSTAISTSAVDCVDLSRVPDFLKPLVRSANGGKPDCSDLAPPTGTPSTTLEATTSTAAVSEDCVDLSAVPAALKSAVLFANRPKPACPEHDETTATTQLPTLAFTSPTTEVQACRNLNDIPSALRPLAIRLKVVCPESATTTSSTATSITTTTEPGLALSTTASPFGNLTCLNLTGIPVAVKPLLFFLFYPLQECTNSSSGGSVTPLPAQGGSSDCIDVSAYPEGVKEIILVLNRPRKACTDTGGAGSVTSNPGTSADCADLSEVPDALKPLARLFILPRQECASPTSAVPGLTNTPSDCVNLAGVPQGLRKLVLNIMAPRQACSESVTSSTTTSEVIGSETTLPLTASPPIVVGGLFGNITCLQLNGLPESFKLFIQLLFSPLTECSDSDSPTSASTPVSNSTNKNCVDVSGFPDTVKGIVLLLNFPKPPCNEDVSGTTSSSAGGFTLFPTPSGNSGCVDISQVPKVLVPILLLMNFPRPACDASVTSATPVTGAQGQDCVDLSRYNPVIRQLLAGFIHPLKPCEEGQTTTQANTNTENAVTGSTVPTSQTNTGSLPCLNITGFEPVYRPIVVILIYPRVLCDNNSDKQTEKEALTTAVNQSPIVTLATKPVTSATQSVTATSNTIATQPPMTTTSPPTFCVDISGFSPEQRVAVMEAIKPAVPCPTDTPTTTSTSSRFSVSATTSAPSTTASPTTTSNGQPCVDLSLVPEFFRPAVLKLTPNRKPCDSTQASSRSSVSVTLSTVIQPDTTPAVTRQSVPPTLTLSTSDTVDGATSSPACIDLYEHFGDLPEEEREMARQFLEVHGILVCPEDLKTSPTTESYNSLSCANISMFSEVQKAAAITFFSLYDILPCPETTSPSSPPAQSSCVDLNRFSTDQRSSAIAFFSLYGLLPCPAATPSSDNLVSPQPSCVDVSRFPANERAGITSFLALYGLVPCSETPATPGGDSSKISCVDISIFPEDQQDVVTRLLKPLVPCPDGAVTAPPTTPGRTQQVTTTAADCIDLVLIPPALRAEILKLYSPLKACEDLATAAHTQVTNSIQETQTPTVSTVEPGGNNSSSSEAGRLELTSEELCQGCFLQGGIGFNPDPSTCNGFVMCSLDAPDGNWTHHLIPCPPHTFWAQELLTCVRAEESSCIVDQCSNPTSTFKMASSHLLGCQEYIQCDGGAITRHCCPEGQVFLEGVCQDGDNVDCPSTCTQDIATTQKWNDLSCAVNRPVPSDPLTYQRYDPGQGWVTMDCAPGTSFNQLVCTCIDKTDIIMPTATSYPRCINMFELSTSGGVVSDAARHSWIFSDSIMVPSISDDLACFQPHNESNFRVPAFNNYDFQDRIHFTVELTVDPGFTSGQAAILSNCATDDHVTPAFYIGLGWNDNQDSLLIRGTLLTEDLTVPAVLELEYPGGLATVDYKYNGTTFTLAVDDVSDSLAVTGNMPKRQSDLSVGYPSFGNDTFFHGCIKTLILTTCDI